MDAAWLWVPLTLMAATSQLLRNVAQSQLTARIGTLGSTQVRFVFGFPFALLFLLGWLAASGDALPALNAPALAWAMLGAIAQIGATALMLVVMQERAFGVAYAYIKTEPATVALLGALLLGDALSVGGWIAVGIVTVGVLLAATRPGDLAKLFGEARPAVIGVVGGALFGLSAIAFRGAIDSVPSGSFVMRSLEMLAISLAIQSLLLGLWLALRDRAAFAGSLREWRRSIRAGLLGALASAGWFMAFSLTAAANVRTLGLVEMPLAALLSHRISGKRLTRAEGVGTGLVLSGVALLLASHRA